MKHPMKYATNHCRLQALMIVLGSAVYLSACGVGPQEAVDRSQPIAIQKNPDKSESENKRDIGIGQTSMIAMEEANIESLSDSDAVRLSMTPSAAPVSLLPPKMKREKASVMGRHIMGVPTLAPVDREKYQALTQNPVQLVAENPVSTFSIDVDTGSYSNVRRFINNGRLPEKNAVRVEELVNYFNYDYPQPTSRETPFLITAEVAPAPWNTHSHLLHIGVKGYEVDRTSLPNANLVFLVDVSGSMNSPKKLGLLKQSLKLLTQKIRAEDRISIVAYAGASGVILDGASGSDKAVIHRAIDQFHAGGSTNGASGIRLAYQLAEQHFVQGGINRVILATDGDFNVGTVNVESLIDMVEKRRDTGISLTTLGFGQGNYNDHLMEQLADKGNGNHAYIDTLQEARKVLVEQVSSTLFTIAKDVKIQVEFNPAIVQEYRLIGYENRALKREDFNNDNVDAGDIGAGHSVTALYEVTFSDKSAGHRIDPLRYGHAHQDSVVTTSRTREMLSREVAFVKLRYKQPDADTSQLMTLPILEASVLKTFDAASDRFKFSAAVAGFGQILSGARYTQGLTLENVEHIGVAAKGVDRWGYRSEFVNLVRLANALEAKG